MRKIRLVIEREYVSRVMKKSFLLVTILVPVIMIGFYALILFIAFQDDKNIQRFAVIDEAGFFKDSVKKRDNSGLKFEIVKDKSEEQFINEYRSLGFDGFLYIPVIDSSKPFNYVMHSASNLSMSTNSEIEDIINDQVEDNRLLARGIDPVEYRKAEPSVKVINKIDTEKGSEKSNSGVAFAISMICGFLIYFIMIIYGTQVMRGVSEEKTNRIAEVITSSVKPFDMMMGKILGIGAVGLTQFAIWIILGVAIQAALSSIMPGLANADTTAGQPTNAVLTEITTGISSLPLLKIGLAFIFYFVGGYLTYAALFAAVGSVVSEDQQEAQQLTFPILMPLILGFIIMMRSIDNPNSDLSIFGSIFPLTSPVVMMGRITYDIPFWQLSLSVILLIACFVFFTWIAAKIYRTGILLYGKKPRWKEMLKWAFR